MIIVVAVIVIAGYFILIKIQTSIRQTAPTSTQIKVSIPTSYEDKLIVCKSIPNNSIQKVVETSRLFINLPKDVYPYENINYNFSTVNGNATAGYVSNGGPPGQAFEATPKCWSTYFEFDGNGEVDLKVKSAIKGMPDYFARFVVDSI